MRSGVNENSAMMNALLPLFLSFARTPGPVPTERPEPNGAPDKSTYAAPTCVDAAQPWKDSDGFSCTAYKDKGWCSQYGDYGKQAIKPKARRHTASASASTPSTPATASAGRVLRLRRRPDHGQRLRRRVRSMGRLVGCRLRRLQGQ